MKLESVVLAVIVVAAVVYAAVWITGLVVFVPWGWLGLIPLALVIGLLAAVIWQRLNNKEDDYYDRNVDK
jgi:CHASE2 domain-containing sensor protein